MTLAPSRPSHTDPAGRDARAAQARALLAAGLGPEALDAWRQALESDPDCAPGYHGAGLALELMGDDRGALASHRHALALEPGYAAAAAALALDALRRRRLVEAREHAALAMALDADDPGAGLATALLDLEDDRFAAAEARLRAMTALATPAQESLARRALGDALDGLSRPHEAFEAYAASAGIFRRVYARNYAGAHPLSGLDLCNALLQGVQAAPPSLWTPAPGREDGGAAGHVFIVGFPRSGTTLLEQVLASHPRVVALEEAPTLKPAIDAYLDPPSGIAALADMDEETAERWRRDYWTRVRDFGADPSGKVFVDKQPFYSLWLPLIARLFPTARILIARRDPRDVLLSCFRHPFRMTPVTYELMDLDRAAQLYDGAMRLIDLFRAKAANPSLAYRHEDLVDDFDGVAGRICAFLDLTWDPRLRDFAQTARQRPVRTPSARQVVRGLNRAGIGAWRPYAAQLSPILPRLEPWVKTLKYPP